MTPPPARCPVLSRDRHLGHPKDATLTPVLQTWKLRFRGVKCLSSGHPTEQGGARNPRAPGPGRKPGAETLTKTTASGFSRRVGVPLSTCTF